MRILITGGRGNIAKILKKHLSIHYDIINPSHTELDLLDFEKLKLFLNVNRFDILIHTAILGGRRTKEETGEITHKNVFMFENLLYFSDNFKMIINFDSAAIYDRASDILNRKEEDLLTIPNDYYGFSKYIIYQRSLAYANIYNFRIFNIFHANEEENRFIKSCFIAQKNDTTITIFEDKYFDFVYEDDFIKIIKYYLESVNTSVTLDKTINICYDDKYKLSDIAKKIITKNENIIIGKKTSLHNYSGNNSKLSLLNLNLFGLEKALEMYALAIQ